MQQESFLKCQKSILQNPALSCILSVLQVISKTHSVKTKTCAIRKVIEKLETLLWVHCRFVFERGGELAWRNMERRWFRSHPSFFFSFSIIFYSFAFLHVCMCAIACVWRSETNSWELFLSFHHVRQGSSPGLQPWWQACLHAESSLQFCFFPISFMRNLTMFLKQRQIANGKREDLVDCQMEMVMMKKIAGYLVRFPFCFWAKGKKKKIGPHLCNYNRFPFHAGRKVHHLWFSITSAFCLHHFYSPK